MHIYVYIYIYTHTHALASSVLTAVVALEYSEKQKAADCCQRLGASQLQWFLQMSFEVMESIWSSAGLI